jgi:two-component system sensor histidine kinase DegS
MPPPVPASEPVEAGSPTALDELATRLAGEIAGLDKELAEIDRLVGQARIETARHEAKRAGAAEKLSSFPGGPGAGAKEVLELASGLVGLTRRAAVMEAQVDVLEGKRRALARHRDALARHADEIGALARSGATGGPPPVVPAFGGAEAGLPPAVSRVVLAAQEDLRREIARAMHDGPAQSLTNIVLQAQIVEHLLERDPDQVREEVRLLESMVQQTLDATKSFIFDVRPMVLDDLGLVPTLRRATRDRGRRAAVPVGFESQGQDRRLPMELESALFRMLDEALAAYLDQRPDRVSVRLDWGDQLVAGVSAVRAAPAEPEEPPAAPAKRGKTAAEMPPALAAMIEDRRVGRLAAARVELSPAAWREISSRAVTIGVAAELAADGSELRLVADMPPEG